MERIGASLVLEPIIFNNIIVGKFFEQFSIENKSKFLQEIISGDKIYSLLFSPNSNYDNLISSNLKVKKQIIRNNFWKINFIFGLNEVDYLLVPILINNEIYIYILKKDLESLEIRNFETIDNLTVSEIEFSAIELKETNLLIKIDKETFFKKLDYIIDYATLSMCSQALGIIDKMYELTLEYCKTREQFGKK